MIHADLCGDHILGISPTLQLNGIIDWEDAVVGDPALDFVGILYLAGWEVVEEILRKYKSAVDFTFRDRVEFYLQAIPFHQIRLGLETADRTHVQRGIEILSRLMK